MITAAAMCAMLELAIVQAMKLDPDSHALLSELRGKVIKIETRSPDISLFFIITDDGIKVQSRYSSGRPDVSVRGSMATLLRASLSGQQQDMMLKGEIEISGDIETGRIFQSVLQRFDIDWEEHASYLVGDMVAHKAGHVVRGARDWLSETLTILKNDSGEYLQEESRLLPLPNEIDKFVDDVDRLRNDASRVEQRMRRLDKMLTQD